MRPITDLQRTVAPFKVESDFSPSGDQPTAIAELERRVHDGEQDMVLLGATAGKAVFGPSFRVTQSRGVLLPWPPGGDTARFGSGQALATLHPSAVLRSDDVDAARAGLVADLRVAAQALGAA